MFALGLATIFSKCLEVIILYTVESTLLRRMRVGFFSNEWWEGLTLLGPQSRFGDKWGQTTWNLTGVSPKRDWSCKRVKACHLFTYYCTTATSFRGQTTWNHTRKFQQRRLVKSIYPLARSTLLINSYNISAYHTLIMVNSKKNSISYMTSDVSPNPRLV